MLIVDSRKVQEGKAWLEMEGELFNVGFGEKRTRRLEGKGIGVVWSIWWGCVCRPRIPRMITVIESWQLLRGDQTVPPTELVRHSVCFLFFFGTRKKVETSIFTIKDTPTSTGSRLFTMNRDHFPPPAEVETLLSTVKAKYETAQVRMCTIMPPHVAIVFFFVVFFV